MHKHPDADAFMRACLDNPTDTTTRLVFADWLEDTGIPHNTAWAHFIRAKIEADGHPHDSAVRRTLNRKAETFAPHIRAKLTLSAWHCVRHHELLFQLLPVTNIIVRIGRSRIARDVVEMMPESVARENCILPLDSRARTLFVAAADVSDFVPRLQTLEFILNRDIILIPAARADVQQAIDREYGTTEIEVVDFVLLDASQPVFYSLGLALAEPIRGGADE